MFFCLQMIASVNLTGMSLGLFEAHPRGNSLSNYEFDWENTIDTLMPDLISRLTLYLSLFISTANVLF